MIKETIKKLLANTHYGKSRYLNFLHRYDMSRYLEHSGMNENNAEILATKMRLIIHPLEKALSLKNVRAGFGKEKVMKLISLYEEYSKAGGKDKQVIELAESIILNYIDFQSQHDVDVSFIPQKFFKNNTDKAISGAIDITSENFDALSDFERIAENRHSIRNFAPEKVDREKLAEAVRIAQTAPSACNRQSTRVYVCDNADKCKKIIARHGGMSGFTDTAAILAITGDLNLYQNEFERHTLFVDGGIFLMNLLYALGSQGIANCPIIWGSEPDNDTFLYELLNIPKSETIVSLVMVGNLPKDGAKAAKSYKRDTQDILKFID
ncbi:MAG: nitroreductase family protein [Clostridia bacterium]|nr:nitroreductase family protein [Clostridia bacterium]